MKKNLSWQETLGSFCPFCETLSQSSAAVCSAFPFPSEKHLVQAVDVSRPRNLTGKKIDNCLLCRQLQSCDNPLYFPPCESRFPFLLPLQALTKSISATKSVKRHPFRHDLCLQSTPVHFMPPLFRVHVMIIICFPRFLCQSLFPRIWSSSADNMYLYVFHLFDI